MLWRFFMKRAFFFSISLLLTNSFFAEVKSFSCDPKKYLLEDLIIEPLKYNIQYDEYSTEKYFRQNQRL